MNLRSRAHNDFASPELILRKKHKTDLLRHTKSMTLGRLGRQKKENPAAIFRSPSIYDDHGKVDIRREPLPAPTEEDTMTSYLSGKICPLTPSIKPCNVDHLAKKPPSPLQDNPAQCKPSPEHVVQSAQAEPVEKNQEDTEEAMAIAEEDRDDVIKVNPIAIHDGILNQKRSMCTIS